MKRFLISGFLVLLVLMLFACSQDTTPEVDLDATVRAAVQGTQAARPADTPTPDLQATVMAAVEATVSAQELQLVSDSPDLDRLHRSYPAPTGYPGFRKYYQKRCYPGCHTYGTPTPDRVHP